MASAILSHYYGLTFKSTHTHTVVFEEINEISACQAKKDDGNVKYDGHWKAKILSGQKETIRFSAHIGEHVTLMIAAGKITQFSIGMQCRRALHFDESRFGPGLASSVAQQRQPNKKKQSSLSLKRCACFAKARAERHFM